MSELLLLLVLLINTALIAIAYHKLSKAIQTVRRESARTADNVISQLEALLAIYAEVRPSRGLPKSRGWAASPDFLSRLIAQVQQRMPNTVVECSSGLSTVVLAASMRNVGRGHAWSMEHDMTYAEQTRHLLELYGLTEWATVLHAPLTPYDLGDWRGPWYDVSTLPKRLAIDMVVIDGPPHDTSSLARYPALPLLSGALNPTAVILLDDANRDDERACIERWGSRYSQLKRLEVADCEKGVALLQWQSV